ncbi:Cleavage and polyadenylation specificity factor subunit [Nymphaea thermarum]|nr:Cleavage and polyadenylation specificity factor subunit [Nymphaea thermarum]
MDPMSEEQLDYEDEDEASAAAGAPGGGHKLQYPGGGAISALAEEELLGEDDDYDDLYNDVNVGEGFMNSIQQHHPPNPNPNPSNLHPMPNGLQLPPAPLAEPSSSAAGSSGFRASEPPGGGVNIPGVGFQDGKSTNTGIGGVGGFSSGNNDYAGPKARASEIPLDPAAGNLEHRGSIPQGKPIGVGVPEQGGNMAGGPASMPGGVNRGPGIVASRPPLQQMQMQQPQPMKMQPQPQHRHQMQMQPQQQMQPQPPPQQQQQQQQQPMVESNGNTMLFVGELHWWTTDAELESELSKYGKVKEIKFFDERASGKSKGYCQVEFYDAAAAASCMEGMNGHVFNGRSCLVVFATQQNLRQMGAAYLNKTQAQAQAQQQGRRGGANNNDGNRNGGMNYQGGMGDNRNYGRMGSGRGGQGMQNRGQGGNYMQNRVKGNMGGGGAGGGSGGAGAGKGMMTGAFGGPAVGAPPGALMHPQGLMGPGFDPTYGSHMGRGGIYGGFPAPAFPGMMPTFPAVNNAVALPGVAPHVNPAFFGRGMTANGMGMMGAPGMDGHPAGMWTDPSMGVWTPEEHGRTRESSYGDDGASDYAYGESQDRGGRSGNTSRDKERGGSERDSDRRHRDDREADWDRHRYKDDKEGYSDHRNRERDWGNEEDWDRGRSSSSRSRSKTRMSQEEEKRSRSRDVDYAKRRRRPSE